MSARRVRLLVCAAGCVLLFTLVAVLTEVQRRQTNAASAAAAQAAPAAARLPRRVLWVWERPEDLRTLHPATDGAAVLEETLELRDGVVVRPRRNPLILPTGTERIAVVRIETGPGLRARRGTRALEQATAQALVAVAQRPGIAALQIDFDARRSERTFYRRLLEDVRSGMPAGLPLEITALVSWCAEDDWIGTLPVNAATPMFFRMEPGRVRLRAAAALSARLPEPLCNSTVGVSMDEPWPVDLANRRVYLFPAHGWKADLSRLRETAKSQAAAPPQPAPTSSAPEEQP